MAVLVTGSAGFIGFHTAQALLARGESVLGLDTLTPYYDPKLKEARLTILQRDDAYRHLRVDLADRTAMERVFGENDITRVVHLAGQAGVRYSLDHPHSYAEANLTGFLNVLEGARAKRVEHLVFASTSSVYGANGKMPFRVEDSAEHPLSLYAATKKANEAMAHSYAHLFGVPMTGLRFFTVYGPWGRPDMALFLFADAMLKDEAIKVYGQGKMTRDFTYVGDIVSGILAALDRVPSRDAAWDAKTPNPASSGVAPFRLYNLGNAKQVPLLRYIEILEKHLGITAKKNFLPIQPGEVFDTLADIETGHRELGYEPKTSIEDGVKAFVEWYREYYRV
jgi:UDP-glucuronate 4-epimerase